MRPQKRGIRKFLGSNESNNNYIGKTRKNISREATEIYGELLEEYKVGDFLNKDDLKRFGYSQKEDIFNDSHILSLRGMNRLYLEEREGELGFEISNYGFKKYQTRNNF